MSTSTREGHNPSWSSSNRPSTQVSDSSEATASPGPPLQIEVKQGWQTSEAHLTGIFGLLAIALGVIGYKTTPEAIGNIYEMLLGAIKTLGPIAAFVPILFNYITTRGKTKSNAALATAAMNNPMGHAALLATAQQGLMANASSFLGNQQGFGIDSLLTTLGGGTGKKDPQTYIGLARILAGLAPGGQVVSNILDKTGIGGVPGSSSGANSPGSSVSNSSAEFQAEIEKALTQIVQTINDNRNSLTAAVLAWWNSEYPDQQARTLDQMVAFATQNASGQVEAQGGEDTSPQPAPSSAGQSER